MPDFDDAYLAAMEKAWELVDPSRARETGGMPGHWKDPIDTLVTVEEVDRLRPGYRDTDALFCYIREAVAFYTATDATVREVHGPGGLVGYRVTAAGYRAGPAGDH